MSYGFCPKCGAAGVSRERRPDGNDKCENGHVYPSKDAQQIVLQVQPVDWCVDFINDVGDKVGKLKFDSQGQLEFSGDADEAARMFFQYVIEANSRALADKDERIEYLEEEVSRLSSEVACYR